MFKYLVFICVLSYSFAYSQKAKVVYDIDDANEHYNHKNYLMALPIYKELLNQDNTNTTIHYKIAECYLNTHINKAEAIKYLEFCVKDPKVKSAVWLRLGEAYRLANKIDEAIKAFETYKQLEPKKKKETDREIEICKNAKTLIQNPVNVVFTNLGKEINSEFADYYPWISQDESFMVFTSRRKSVMSNRVEVDGYYGSDIYKSRVQKGNWLKAENMGPNFNTNLDEQVVGLRADGSEMLIYIDHIDKYGDIYTSSKKKEGYAKYLSFPENINKKIEHSACISADGKTMFFVRSDKKDEQTDIYVCKSLPNKEWSEPQKLGPEVNTAYDEDFPYLSIDGKTLYFASKGHNTMGGFDLFKSSWNAKQNTFSKAVNLGYPLNTTDDDRSICLTSDNRAAYISAIRPGGQGDLDIYRVKFMDLKQKMTLYYGKVILDDSLNRPKKINVSILATSTTNTEKFTFVPNSKTGKFVMALPAGTYLITISSPGFTDLNDKISVSDLGLQLGEENKEYRLTRDNMIKKF